MTDESKAKLLMAYKYAAMADQDGIADLLEDVILDVMGGGHALDGDQRNPKHARAAVEGDVHEHRPYDKGGHVMSDTESFESAYERLYPQLHNPCGLWKAATIAEWLDDLERAHDREIAQARDPQRLRGTKPDTFDGAIEALREFRWQHATNDEDAIPYINAVKEMHDREIRDVSQREYDRGFHEGQHSMDAEHRAIAMRLRRLPLDGGSHENLSQIARAIYHADFGWTHGACAALRDKLIDLMGGVSDDTAEPMTTDEFIEYINQDTRRLRGDASKAGDGDDTCGSQCRGACADSDGRDSGKHAEVSDGGTTHDSAADSRGGDSGGDLHMAGLVGYDVLGNEQHKAIAELRNARDSMSDSMADNVSRIMYAISARPKVGERACKAIADRLINLLGGDQPSGIDVLRAMDEREAEGRITDELREFVDNNWPKILHETKTTKAYVLLRIADRIDEQFDRICQQQEAVLQKTIDGMVKEYEHDRLPDQLRIEKMEKQRDHWRQQATDLMNHADAMEHERDAARARTDELSDELLRTRRERDELRAKLATIRETIDG